jgi:hypothetical protein
MSKIYNEIVIDMNPQSPSFEKVIYEDSFEHSGDMMLAGGGDRSQGRGERTQSIGELYANLQEGDKRAYREEGSPTFSIYEWKMTDAGELGWVKGEPWTGEDADLPYGIMSDSEWETRYQRKEHSIEELGLGMGDVTAEEMLSMNEEEMLEWIINTKYGGTRPDHVSEKALLEQIRTKIPQKSELGITDWYGIQDTTKDVTAQGRNVYGGMGTGMREQVAGRQQVEKDVYGLTEDKAKSWTSKFRSFLGSLPSAT